VAEEPEGPVKGDKMIPGGITSPLWADKETAGTKHGDLRMGLRGKLRGGRGGGGFKDHTTPTSGKRQGSKVQNESGHKALSPAEIGAGSLQVKKEPLSGGVEGEGSEPGDFEKKSMRGKSRNTGQPKEKWTPPVTNAAKHETNTKC